MTDITKYKNVTVSKDTYKTITSLRDDIKRSSPEQLFVSRSQIVAMAVNLFEARVKQHRVLRKAIELKPILVKSNGQLKPIDSVNAEKVSH